MEEFAIETLREMVEAVRVASPALWQIARRQVWANLAETVAWLLFSAVTLWASVRWYLWLNVKSKEDGDYNYEDYDLPKVLAVLVAFFSAITLTCLIGGAVKTVVNPDYYAIRTIMDLIK